MLPRSERRFAVKWRELLLELVGEMRAREAEAGVEDGADEQLEGGEVVDVAHPLRGPRHVDGVAGARLLARLVVRARPRVEFLAEAVERDVEDAAVAVEDLLRAWLGLGLGLGLGFRVRVRVRARVRVRV